MDIRNNLLSYLKVKYSDDLTAFYPAEEAKQLVNLLIRHFFNLSRTDLVANSGIRLSESEILTLHFAVKDLKKYKPLQYITGETEFLGLIFFVNPSVLIPRPETEELTQLIIDREKKSSLKVLDIGTGSGCIAISLGKHLHSPAVTAIDLSKEAIQLAAANARKNKSVINLFQFDILDKASWKTLCLYDIIISNPPYVTESDKSSMSENVLNYEPHQALFVPEEDELIFYHAIISFAKNHLVDGGRLYFEINENKGKEIATLIPQQEFKNVEIRNDLTGKNRFVIAEKNSTIAHDFFQ